MNEFEAGKIAEKFFYRYSGRLIHKGYILYQTSDAHIGGMDFNGLAFDDIRDSKPVIGGFPYETKPHQTAQYVEVERAEVKCIRGKTLLTRNNNEYETSGTVEFEMWSNAYNQQGKLNPRAKWTHGWMHGYLHPVEHGEELMKLESSARYTTPDMLVYVHYADKAVTEPFAVIAFEDFRKLIERLKTIAPWDLDPWKVDFLSDKRFYTISTPSKSYLLDNMWHVPLEAIADLATVTMINNDPYTNGGIDKTRLDYLKKLAAGRHLDTKEEDRIIQRVEEAHSRDREKRN